MKKITLFVMTIMISTMAWSQCTTGGAYQGATLTNDGSWELQSGCNYTGEYSNTTNIIDGDTYTFRSEVATDYITVTSSNGAIIYGHGVQPLTLTLDTSDDLNNQAVRVYYHNNAACGSSNNCRDTEVRNDTVAVNLCPDIVNFTAVPLDVTADLTWDEDGVSATSYIVEVYLAGESAQGGNTPVYANASVSGTTVVATGLEVTTAYEAYIMTTCSGATTMSQLVGPLAFATTAACTDATDLGSNTITATSANITFTPGTGNDSVLVEVYASGESAANGDIPVYTNSATAGAQETATGLMESTDYDAFVTGFCGTIATTVQGPESFRTRPANDDFADATPINCASGIITGSTFSATIDEDDAPDGGGADLDAPNVWYAINSSVDGASDVTLDLCGSDYDTSVLIYRGTSGNLTFVAGNDDNTAACGDCCQSLLTFPTDGISTYYITVEGYEQGSIGDFVMLVSCVPVTPAPDNDDCFDAIALTTGVPVSGTTVGATTSFGDSPICDTFGSVADVWYSVNLTGSASNLSITTTITGTSDQANIALYDDCAAFAANSLGCTIGNGGETLNVSGLSNGTYYIRVWSDGNAPPTTQGRIEGTFNIVVNATLSEASFEDESAFTYYPNPVENTLTLRAQNAIDNVTMYNMLGQVILRATPNSIDSELNMSSLQDGTYFIKVTIANKTKTVRVIKQ